MNIVLMSLKFKGFETRRFEIYLKCIAGKGYLKKRSICARVRNNKQQTSREGMVMAELNGGCVPWTRRLQQII